MSKSIIIAERDNIAAVVENNKVVEFFIHRGDILLGDVYLANVENILPSIDAAFVNVGSDRMGFLHASDVVGKGALQDKLKPKQKVIVQVVKEPTGHKGPRVTTAISLPGRFLVLMPDEKGISVSRKISSPKERARLKSIVSLLKPVGVGVILRTEAENQSESEIQEDLEILLEKWNTIITTAESVEPPSLLYRDQDLLYRVIREACTEDIDEIILDTSFAYHRANQLLQSWNMNQNINVSVYKGSDPILMAKGIDKEIRSALQTKVNMPSGGYLYIQTTEALTVIDVNSGKFTSSATQGETILKTNLEAVDEIARQLRLRNIGGMIIIDFIDMENRTDKLAILEHLEVALEPDKSNPQVGQLSDLGLVELTRHRQGQSLSEIFTKKCPSCNGTGMLVEEFNFMPSVADSEYRSKAARLKLPQKPMKKQQDRQFNGDSSKVKTSPSVVADYASKQRPVISEGVELSPAEIKSVMSQKTFTPEVSQIVKMNPLPAETLEKHLGNDFAKDTFDVLESGEKAKAAEENVVEQGQQRPQDRQRGNYYNKNKFRPKQNYNQGQQQRPHNQQQTPKTQQNTPVVAEAVEPQGQTVQPVRDNKVESQQLQITEATPKPIIATAKPIQAVKVAQKVEKEEVKPVEPAVESKVNESQEEAKAPVKKTVKKTTRAKSTKTTTTRTRKTTKKVAEEPKEEKTEE